MIAALYRIRDDAEQTLFIVTNPTTGASVEVLAWLEEYARQRGAYYLKAEPSNVVVRAAR